MNQNLGYDLVDLLQPNRLYLLYKDWPSKDAEIFILTKHMEIFEYDDTTLGLYVWTKAKASVVRKNWAIWEDNHLDEKFTVLRVNKDNLTDLLGLGIHKKRPHRNGKWLKSIEETLGHPIIPYKTKG